MSNDWKSRLTKAIEADERSYRELSRQAGFGPNYVRELVTGTKVPSVENVMKLADLLGVSMSYLFTGLRISGLDEEFLQLLVSLPDDEKEHLLALLRARKAPVRS